MSKATINLITEPDKLFNKNLSLLLVNPSDQLKEDFNKCAGNLQIPINLYLYESHDNIAWLLDIAQSADHVIVDIDNTKENQWIIGHLLSFGKTYYLTNATDTVYNIVNVNRIHDLTQFMEGAEYFGVQKI